jgi:acyl carrier protein
MSSAPLTEQGILEGIVEVARAHLAWEGEVSLTTPLVELFRLDSIRLLTLVVEIENRFEICLDDAQTEQVETVGDLVTLIRTTAMSGG